jgi:hypothetical protein
VSTAESFARQLSADRTPLIHELIMRHLGPVTSEEAANPLGTMLARGMSVAVVVSVDRQSNEAVLFRGAIGAPEPVEVIDRVRL